MSIRAYVLRRIAQGAVVLVLVSVVTFAIARIVPSDPARLWVGTRATADELDLARRTLGLDRPIYVQYWIYITDLLRGDLGTSVQTHQPIGKDLASKFPATLELVLTGILLAAFIGIPLGVVSAARRGHVFDSLSRFGSVALVSLPTFWLGLIMQVIFFGQLHWLPLGGRLSRAVELVHPIQSITGLYTVDAAISGNWPALADVVSHLILPAFAVASFALGTTIRMTRANMLEVLGQPYILAARAAGLPERTILLRLALRNAVMPTLLVLGLTAAYALTGAIIVEVIFSWPGLGSYMLNAIVNLDYPIVVSVTLLSSVVYVLINLALDLVQPVLDPRVALG